MERWEDDLADLVSLNAIEIEGAKEIAQKLRALGVRQGLAAALPPEERAELVEDIRARFRRGRR